MNNQNNPHIYLHFIDQNIEAYQILKDKYPLPIDLFFVKAYLLGRTIELILKTELLLKGHDSKDFRKQSIGGHDLLKLLLLLGFPSDYIMSPTLYDAIQHINIYYKDKKYEYPEEDVEIKNVAFLEEFILISTNKIRFKLNKMPVR